MGSAITGELACMDMRAKWGRLGHYSTAEGLARRPRRQRSEQKRTSFQQRSHFLRQTKGRPQDAQDLDGRLALATRWPGKPLPFLSPMAMRSSSQPSFLGGRVNPSAGTRVSGP